MNKIKSVHIFGGGTVAHITNHFAICAPAYGQTACTLGRLAKKRFDTCNIQYQLTRMAGGDLETNADVARRVEDLKGDPNTKVIFFNVAMCDWEPVHLSLFDKLPNGAGQRTDIKGDKCAQRLETKGVTALDLQCAPADKVIGSIRQGRKDIFLIGFKATCGATPQEMFTKGLRLCKEASVNLVLVNDTKTKHNMICTPEEAAYHETGDRHEALKQLVDMAWYRSQLTFTQSTVVEGKPVAWTDPRVPSSLRAVIDHLINGNAYKPFNGATVGHFACRLSDTEFLTSIRKTDFNKLADIGLVLVRTSGPDTVLAYGAKPSVGGQSQRIVFKDHPGFDCIAHAHVPLRPDHPDDIPVRSQREIECGSSACGNQTSQGLKQFGNLKAVMLDQHGPNIVFPSSIDPQEVITFIERNWDLTKKTGGYNV